MHVHVLRETDHSKVARDMEEHAAPVNTENVLLYHKVKYDEYLQLRATTSATKTTQPQPKTSAPKQSSLEASFTRSVPYEKKSRKWRDITNAVTYHIAKDMVPIATVEKEGFKTLLKTIDPR
ncbi:E3 SUMO-protein ligase ZBED1 [Labeo rohita]|uniref:E3 SUMO-protein ligase ZBED1 n=1 Tax=Labeo rohita TaxID=84645 RepID=A0ABQ8LBQ3_LABRO|nr:E3 SUMO-protein ligase ZBED1 [Labeo rohita]